MLASAHHAPEARAVSASGAGSSSSSSVCHSDHAEAFVVVLLLYKGVYLVYGAYLAWAIRHVTIPPMDDCSCILIASHVTVICTCLAISAEALLADHRLAVFACTTTTVWIATSATCC